MELFIRIVNGEPFEHPIFGDNFREAFPHIDVENLPPEFARFERVPKPSLVYATLNSAEPTYEWVDGVVKDVWDITHMTDAEKTAKIAKAKTLPHPNSWIFNETACEWQPPQE